MFRTAFGGQSSIADSGGGEGGMGGSGQLMAQIIIKSGKETQMARLITNEETQQSEVCETAKAPIGRPLPMASLARLDV